MPWDSLTYFSYYTVFSCAWQGKDAAVAMNHAGPSPVAKRRVTLL
jgi:hypothetical protein